MHRGVRRRWRESALSRMLFLPCKWAVRYVRAPPIFPGAADRPVEMRTFRAIHPRCTAVVSEFFRDSEDPGAP